MEQYPQDIKFSALKEKSEQLGQFSENVLNVKFDLRGREYNGQFYVDLNAWRIERGDQTAGMKPVSPQLSVRRRCLPFHRCPRRPRPTKTTSVLSPRMLAPHQQLSWIERALNAYAQGFQRWLYSPFTIAVIPTMVAAGLAMTTAAPNEVLDAWTQAVVEGRSHSALDFGRCSCSCWAMCLPGTAGVAGIRSACIDWIVKTPANAPAKVAFRYGSGLAQLGSWFDCRRYFGRGVMDRRRREGSGSP